MPALPLTSEQKADAARLKGIYVTKKNALGWTQESLAQACGWESQGTVSQYLNGKIPLNLDAALKFAHHLQCLVSDFSPKLADTLNEPADKPVPPSSDFVPIRRVQIKVSAGVTGYYVEPLQGDGPPIFFRADWIASKRLRADRLVALRVNGASMEPGLYDGDLVVVNADETTPRDGEVFVINYEGEAVIKRLRRDGGLWWLSSDNPDKRLFADKHCDEHALVIGRVIYKQSEHI